MIDSISVLLGGFNKPLSSWGRTISRDEHVAFGMNDPKGRMISDEANEVGGSASSSFQMSLCGKECVMLSAAEEKDL